MRLLGLRRTHGWMRRRVGVQADPDGDSHAIVDVRATARMVALAVRAMPYRVTCLRASLVLWWLLARRGVPSRLVIGVCKPETGFEAHAWVEWGGLVLNDHDRVRERFVPVDWQAADQGGYLAR